MSDNVVKIIPLQPEFEPCIEKIREVEFYLKPLCKQPNDIQFFSDIQIYLSQKIRFIDQGTNFERIGCPFCHNDLSIMVAQRNGRSI